MCLVLFSYRPDAEYPLVVAANRDEFYARPARGAHRWEDRPGLLAGRDLTAGGAWLGVSETGRFATVTNFAEDADETAAESRGELTESFLSTTVSAHDFAHGVDGRRYRGFNLLLWDGRHLVCTSNRGTTQDLAPGTYGLANAELGAKWPKVERGVAALEVALTTALSAVSEAESKSKSKDVPDTQHRLPEGLPDALLHLLSDSTTPPDNQLPRRGRPLEFERRVSPCFIKGSDYGTRASTAVMMGRNHLLFVEQSYGPEGTFLERATFTLEIA